MKWVSSNHHWWKEHHLPADSLVRSWLPHRPPLRMLWPNGWQWMLLHLTPTVFCPKRMEVKVITPYTHCVLSQTDGSQCYYTSHPLWFVPINGVLLNRLCFWILHQLKNNKLFVIFIYKKKKEKRLTYFAGRPCVFWLIKETRQTRATIRTYRKKTWKKNVLFLDMKTALSKKNKKCHTSHAHARTHTYIQSDYN